MKVTKWFFFGYGGGVAHWCFFMFFAVNVVLFRGTTFLLVERLVQINDGAIHVACIFTEHHYHSPKFFTVATLALYAAFVMLVLVLFVPVDWFDTIT
jgi:hypothetical protein